MVIKSVGIRELKTHLSKYLRNVKNGGEVIISERGRVVARIIPANKRSKPPLETILLKLSEEGKIILPTVYKKSSPPLSRKKIEGSPFSDAVREGRR
jgi:prevent-host-death family protein